MKTPDEWQGGGPGLKRMGLAKTHAKWHSVFRGCVWTQAKWPGAKWHSMFWPLKNNRGFATAFKRYSV